jgi:tRNA-dihydrouridine synthase A
MIGRAAYHNPYILAEVDQNLHDADRPILSRQQIAEAFIPYIDQQLAKGERIQSLTRHILGLYHGEPNARLWRRMLSDSTWLKTYPSAKLIEQALTEIKA